MARYGRDLFVSPLVRVELEVPNITLFGGRRYLIQYDFHS
jgi:hypothetical protein